MILFALCVMLCIAGPLPKVSGHSDDDLEEKVKNLESKLEAMSGVVHRLINENKKQDAMMNSFMEENKQLKTTVNRLERMVQDGVACDEEESDTTVKMAKNGAENQEKEIVGITNEYEMHDKEEDPKGRPKRKIQQKGKRILVGKETCTKRHHLIPLQLF
jgi:multidrug resistance efflux pump